MHLTSRVPKVFHAVSVIATLVVISAITAATQSRSGHETLILDLTKPVPREQQSSGVPGATIGGIGGKHVGPLRYELPLSVGLVSLTPGSVNADDQFSAEVLLQNNGRSALFLPASQNSFVTLRQGNRGRHSLVFSLVFKDLQDNWQSVAVMAVTTGSSSLKDSWVRLEPGQQIRVRLPGHLNSIRSWLRPDLKSVQVRAQVSEWISEDERYFIKSESAPIISANSITLAVAPAQR